MMKQILMLVAALGVATGIMAQTTNSERIKEKGGLEEMESREYQTPAANASYEGVSEVRGTADGLQSDGSIARYHRSSLYSVLLCHSNFPYGEEIRQTFLSIPTPDKFNNHNLSVRTIESSARKMRKGRKAEEGNLADINAFINNQDVAREMVAKWFNRNRKTGGLNIDLMLERGFYDASEGDIAMARASGRGLQSVGDGGAELIGKTFLLVNDITYIDHGERSATAGGILRGIGSILAGISGSSAYEDLGNVAGGLASEVDGFKVNITSYLYRLEWNDEIAETFWSQYWTEDPNADPARREAFDHSSLFRMIYVGSTTTSAGNLSSRSFARRSKSEQMLRVCARAIDKSIVELQRSYDEFKVNTPIERINQAERTVEVAIGLKEGINKRSKFDVLMQVEEADGSITYERIGRIEPIEGMIWDNRFGALEALEAGEELDEEGKEGNAALRYTTFRITDGVNRIVPGCLIREATIRRDK